MSIEEGIDSDYVTSIARELLDTGFDLIQDIPDSEKDDVLIVCFVEVLVGLMLAFRIMNPGISHDKILAQVCERIKSDYVARTGIDQTGPQDNFIN